MFYVGDVFWLEKGESFIDIPNWRNFSCLVRYFDGTKVWYDKGKTQSPQNLETQEWLPAIIYPSGREYWCNKGRIVDNPETYDWARKEEGEGED